MGLGVVDAKQRSSPYPTIKVVSWAPKDGSRNFGDHLSQIVTAATALKHGLTLEDEVASNRRLLAIGSILHFAQDGDIVWGSGINGKINDARIKATHLDVRAVRGPKTAEKLRASGIYVPHVFGDPAMLVPYLFADRFRVEPKVKFTIIPNLHDLPAFAENPNVVSPLMGWNRCVEAIVASEFVIASSLHGIILAEAFGVPCRMLRVSSTESQFKYDDYAQGSGRECLQPVGSVEEALSKGPDEPPKIDFKPLLDAFPVDLWRTKDG